MKGFRIILLLMSFAMSMNGQAKINIDSLLSVWNDESQDDNTRIGAIRNVAWVGYLNSQPDSALYYAEELLEFSQARQNARGVNIALTIQATYHKQFGNLKEAIRINEKNLEIQRMAGNDEGISAVLLNLGSIYGMTGQVSKALALLDDAEDLARQRKDTAALFSVYLNKGYTQYNGGEKELGLDYFNKALDLAKLKDNKDGIALALQNIGTYHVEVNKDMKKGIYLFSRVADICEEMNDVFGYAQVMGNIGACYMEMGMTDSARVYFYRNQAFYESLGQTPSTITTMTNLGDSFFLEKNYAKALTYYQKSLDIAEKMGLPMEASAASRNISQTYQGLNDYRSAMEYYKIHIAYQDTLRKNKNEEELIRQEYLIEFEKKAAADSVKAAEETKVKDAQLAAEHAENVKQKQQSYFLVAGLGLALIFGGFIFNRFRLTQKQKKIIEEQKQEVDEAYGQLEVKNTEIMDSINYAQRIQEAILPSEKMWDENLPDSIVLYKPKDIVAGDFYWMEPTDDCLFFAAADCTGHGVPGAMVSVICNNALNRAVREYGLRDPGQILDKTREIVLAEFRKSEEDVKDGMDIALCSLTSEGLQPLDNNGTATLQYAGAHNPLWIIRKGSSEIEEIKADKQPIGMFRDARSFKSHQIELQKGDTVYIFSDGYVDQFGGEKGKKFKVAHFKKLLLSIRDKSMPEQKKRINEVFENWKGSLEQVDDVCVIGVKI